MRFAPGTSQDEIMAAEKAFRDRFQNAAQNSGGGRGPAPVRDIVNPGIPAGLPPKSGSFYPARDVERPPVVNLAPRQVDTPVRDVVNPNMPGLPSKEQVAAETAEQALGEEDFIQSYRDMLDRLNLSRMRRQR